MFSMFASTLLALGASNAVQRRLQECTPASSNLFDDGTSCVNLLTVFEEAEISSVLSDTTNTITVSFPSPPGSNLCAQLLATFSEPFFEYSVTCDISGNDLTLVSTFDINAPDRILKTKLLRFYKAPLGQFFNLQQLISSLDSAYPEPKVGLVIEGPSFVDLGCDFTYTWLFVCADELIQPDENEYWWDVFGDNVSAQLKAFVTAQQGLLLEIDASLMPAGIYHFIVTATADNGLQYFTVHTVESGSFNTQAIKFIPEGPYQINSQDCLDIVAQVDVACGDFYASYSWEFTSVTPNARRLEYYEDPSDVITNSQEDECVLDINAGNLEPGFTYTFTVTANYGTFTGSESVEVIVVFCDPVAYIDIDDGEFYNVEDLVISGEYSLDVDNPGAPLTYAWTCAEEDGSECTSTDGSALISGETGVILTVPKEKLRVGAIYIFTLTVTATSGQTGSECLTLEIVELTEDPEQVDFLIADVSKKFNIFIEIEKAKSLEWHQIYGPSINPVRILTEERELQNLKKYKLKFAAGTVPGGEFYGYWVDYQLREGEEEYGREYVFFYTNCAVTCTGISVVPNGNEFDISIDGCNDNDQPNGVPLLYTLKAKNGNWKQKLLNKDERNIATHGLRPGTNTLEAKVCDAYGYCLELSETFEVSTRRMLRQKGKFLTERDNLNEQI